MITQNEIWEILTDMLAQIDNIIFETNSNIDELLEKFSFNYSEINRIGNNPTYQKTNGYTSEVSFSGYFVLKNLDELNDIKEVGINGKPILFVSKENHFKVIITDLTIRKSIFLKGGEFIKQDFDIELKRYFK